MECTQRLDYESQSERICPEQVGFLGILGTKYPIKKGPNKVGRDPQTCSIVLNLNSISRQHGVINILNNKEFMLMDLDSANKTKLNNKTLQAYIPVPLNNGDTIQFGDIFGIFRLLEEDHDLPATQALDIPDTPVMRRTKQQHQATIPESPDISDRDEGFVMTPHPILQLILDNPRYDVIQLSSPQNSMWHPENSIYLDARLNDSDVSSNIKEANKQCFPDDSFLMPSQPVLQSKFRSPSNKLIELSKTVSLQSSSSKIENNTWNSSKKSTSLNLDDSLNDSGIKSSIHEAETQAPFPVSDKNDDSIFDAPTQIPEGYSNNAHSIFGLDTQLPQSDLPAVCKIENQHNVEIDLFAANKENQYSIFNADTQMVQENVKELKSGIKDDIFDANTQLDNRSKETHDIFIADTQIPSNKNISSSSKSISSDIFTADTQIPSKNEDDTVNNNVFKENALFDKDKPLDTDTLKKKVKVNESDEDILLEELDCEPLSDDFLSQPILSTEQNQDNIEDDIPLSQSDTVSDEFKLDSENDTDSDKIKPLKRTAARIVSDSQSDCEDFDNLPTQKLSIKPINEEDLTDCEDDSFEKVQNVEKETEQVSSDMVDGVKPSELTVDGVSCNEQTIEDLPTQIITACEDVNFEDLPTQVLEEEKRSEIKATADFKPLNTDSPFKVPQHTPLKFKRKDVTKSSDIATLKTTSNLPVVSNMEADDNKYYTATQEILDVLDDDKYYIATQEILDDLSSQKNMDVEITKKSPISSSTKSLNYSDGEESVNDNVERLSVEQINNIIGVEVSKPRKVPSDPSDGEVTPKKVRPLKFLRTELPDSQEIKTSVTLMSKSAVTESSSDSETEIDSQENTPVVFRKKKRVKNDAKKDLFKDFDLTSLPTRIITRTRKPTAKIREGNIEIKEQSKNILKPKFLTEQDEEVDSELIRENIIKLKSKNEKKNIKDHAKSANSVADKSKTNDQSARQAIQKKTSGNKTNKSDSNTCIDLTTNDNKNDHTSMQTSNSKNRPKRKCQNLEEKNDKTITNEHFNKSDHAQGTSNSKTNEPRKSERSAVKNVQGKITNYTVAKASTDSAECLLNENNETTKRTTRQRSKNTTISLDEQKNAHKSDDNVKPKRGRPKASEKKESKTGSETKTVTPESKKEVKPQEDSRRSRRQRTAKSKKEAAAEKHEHSTVYSLSSESNGESPKGVKRAATESVVPASKRVKSFAESKTSSEVMSISSGLSSSSSSRRSTPSRGVRPYHVLFTAFPGDQVKEKLEKLGAIIVGDASSCSVAVTQCIRRTVKLLCAVGLGRPVVGASWVQACVDNQALVDPWQYILKDEANEQRFQFNLEQTLNGPRNYLKGYNLSSTPSVMPGEPEMKQIVQCSGGSWRTGGSRWLAISCKADAAMWPALLAAGARVVSTELVLTGVLRQRLIVEETTLC